MTRKKKPPSGRKSGNMRARICSLIGRSRPSTRRGLGEATAREREKERKKRKLRTNRKLLNHKTYSSLASRPPANLPKENKARMQLSVARSVRPARQSTLKCSAIKAQTPYADELIATAVRFFLVASEDSRASAKRTKNRRRRGRCCRLVSRSLASTFAASHSRSIATSRPLLPLSLAWTDPSYELAGLKRLERRFDAVSRGAISVETLPLWLERERGQKKKLFEFLALVCSRPP